jgi:hypothetical protein
MKMIMEKNLKIVDFMEKTIIMMTILKKEIQMILKKKA